MTDVIGDGIFSIVGKALLILRVQGCTLIKRSNTIMKLTERDLLLFRMLNKFRLLNSDLICFFCNFPSYHAVMLRLNTLYKNGYINKYRKDIYHKYIYFLTQKGINVLYPPKKSNKSKYPVQKNPSKIVYSNIRHELIIASIVKRILELNPDCSIDDIEVDREIRPKEFIKSKKTHIPDIRIEKYRFIGEIELNYKRPNDLIKNIASNHFYYQLWIVPEGKKKLKERIMEQSKIEMNTSIHTISLDQIDTFEFDLKKMNEKLINENPKLIDMMNKSKKKNKQINLFKE